MRVGRLRDRSGTGQGQEVLRPALFKRLHVSLPLGVRLAVWIDWPVVGWVSHHSFGYAYVNAAVYQNLCK